MRPPHFSGNNINVRPHLLDYLIRCILCRVPHFQVSERVPPAQAVPLHVRLHRRERPVRLPRLLLHPWRHLGAAGNSRDKAQQPNYCLIERFMINTKMLFLLNGSQTTYSLDLIDKSIVPK